MPSRCRRPMEFIKVMKRIFSCILLIFVGCVSSFSQTMTGTANCSEEKNKNVRYEKQLSDWAQTARYRVPPLNFAAIAHSRFGEWRCPPNVLQTPRRSTRTAPLTPRYPNRCAHENQYRRLSVRTYSRDTLTGNRRSRTRDYPWPREILRESARRVRW